MKYNLALKYERKKAAFVIKKTQQIIGLEEENKKIQMADGL